MFQLINELKNINSLAIAGHVRPDGDCVGSCLGIYNYVRSNFPEIKVDVYLEEIPSTLLYIENTDKIKHDYKSDTVYDLFIALDSADKDRLGFSLKPFMAAKKTICIDHHISNKGYADINLIESEAASTCEILFYLLDYEKINKDVAVALYTGIAHDTGVFRFSSTTEKTMIAAGKLMSKGIPFSEIVNDSFYQKTYLQNQILGRALLESVMLFQNTCVFAAITKKEMDFYGVKSHDMDGIVNQLLVTEGVECAIFIYEIGNHEYKASLRSKQYLDVSKVASYFGGGGHIRAAGCTMVGTIYDVVNNLSKQIEVQMMPRENKSV
ncbi:MAG: bifunctional oligoribonuclease/PAP phosphatase NrnA [Clostridiales bacterium]|nr:bifunctional oligoribonuclease/PAP phosphatase NrnA [Clostridiales bacterium]